MFWHGSYLDEIYQAYPLAEIRSIWSCLVLFYLFFQDKWAREQFFGGPWSDHQTEPLDRHCHDQISRESKNIQASGGFLPILILPFSWSS